MTLVLTLRNGPRALAHDVAAEIAQNIVRWVLLALGMVLILLGVLMAPLPGPLGLPVTLVGLVLVLRNSFRLRRAFIRVQRKHPRMIFPLRRLLRREPEVFPVAWQQVLRMERLIVPKRFRMGQALRRRYFRARR